MPDTRSEVSALASPGWFRRVGDDDFIAGFQPFVDFFIGAPAQIVKILIRDLAANFLEFGQPCLLGIYNPDQVQPMARRGRPGPFTGYSLAGTQG